MKRVSVYRIVVREGRERVASESLAGQIAEGSLPSSAPPEDLGRPLFFGFQAIDDLLDDLGGDPVAAKIGADQRVARIALGELLASLMRKSIVGEQSGGGQVVERSGPLVLGDSRALEPVFDVPA